MEHFRALDTIDHVAAGAAPSTVDVMSYPPLPPTTAAGNQAHRAIATLLTDGYRRPSTERIDELVASRTGNLGADVNRRAYRQRIGTAVRSYFWHFVLDEPWSFVGAEMNFAGCFIDLVWSRDGQYLFDEVKTHLVTRLALESKADHQSDRYVSVGHEHLDHRFLGVRCLPLLDRTSALLKTAPGVAAPLPDTLLRPAA